MDEAQLWIASCDADGGGVSVMQLYPDSNTNLLELQKEQEKQHPNMELVIHQQLHGADFDTSGILHPLLLETLQLRDPADYTDTVYLAEQYTLCSIGTDGQLVRGPMLQFPYDSIKDDYNFSPTSHLLVDDAVLWVCTTQYVTEGPSGFVCLQFSAVTGECTAEVALPDGCAILDQMLTDDDALLLLARRSDQSFGVFLIENVSGNRPVLSSSLALTNGINQPSGFISSISRTPANTQKILVKADNGIWVCDANAGTAEKLLDWNEYAVQYSISYPIFALLENQFLLVEDGGLSILTQIDEELLEGRQVVTLALTDSHFTDMEEYVTAYNATEPQVYVKIIDYTDEAALERGFASGGGIC